MYGTAMDQARILREHAFPTAMLLPTLFPSKPAGVATAVRHFVEKSGIPAVLYIKDPNYVTPEIAAELVNDGLISWIKYAIVVEDPKKDPYLKKLTKLVDPKIIISGIAQGCIYGLIALGFVLIYKATETVNFAQGELMMLGAFCGLALMSFAGFPFWLAVLSAIAAMALFGIALERVVIRPILGQPAFSIVMLTIGVGYVLRRDSSPVA